MSEYSTKLDQNDQLSRSQAHPRVLLTTKPLCPLQAEALVLNDQCGAVTIFCGRVRDHNEGQGVLSITYEAYEAMAYKVMADIVAEAHLKFTPISALAHHRLGKLEVGDAAVVVAVASAHRKITFEACSWIIEQLKARTPIFKHEHRKDGVVWVGMGP